MESVVTIRKWGNSLGLVLSKKLVEEKNIHANDKVIVDVKKAVPINELFGTLKTRRSTQAIKDELRKGWN